MSPRPSRPTRDPDRRRTPPPHPGFWALPAELVFDVCGLCACPVPATERSRQRHLAWHGQVPQTSGAGSNADTPGVVVSDSPAPDPKKSGAEVPVGASPRAVLPSSASAPDPTSPQGTEDAPTPTPGEGGRAGVEGANQQGKPGTVPPDGATTPPEQAAATIPPGRRPSGGPKPAREDRRDNGSRSVRGRQTSTSGSPASRATSNDQTAGSSPVTLWALEKGLLLSQVLIHLKREHGEHFRNVLSTTDLYLLEGEQAQRAVAYLKAAFGTERVAP